MAIPETGLCNPRLTPDEEELRPQLSRDTGSELGISRVDARAVEGVPEVEVVPDIEGVPEPLGAAR